MIVHEARELLDRRCRQRCALRRARHARRHRRQPRGEEGRPVRGDRRRQGRRAALRRRRRWRAARSRSWRKRCRRTPLPDGVAFVRVGNARRALALAAAKFFSAPAGNHRRRHRHQRQDLGRRLHAPDLGSDRAKRPRASAPSASSRRGGEVYGSLTTPDPVALHRTLDGLAERGRDASGDGGVLARARPAPARRRAHRGRRVHQSQPRPSRLSPDARSLSRRQAAAVRAISCIRAAPP